MSPKIPVLPLKRICAQSFANRLKRLLAEDEPKSTCYEIIKKQLSEVTGHVLGEVLTIILKCEGLDAGVRFRSLELLLRDDVENLRAGNFPYSYYDKILQCVKKRGRGLRMIDFKGVWARDNPVLLASLFNNLSNLTVLIIPHIANDEVLHSLSNCPKLNVLDISGEATFCVAGLMSLRNEKLRLLHIGYFRKLVICEGSVDDSFLIAQLFDNLPELTSIRIYSYTGRSIANRLRFGKIEETKLKYLHDTETSNETLDAIIQLCPQLESIHLNCPEIGVVCRLHKLKQLKELKLSNAPVKEIKEFLERSGKNLETARINHCPKEILDLNIILNEAPKISTMEFYRSTLSFKEPQNYFSQLTNVEILYCRLANGCIKNLLAYAPLLTVLRVGCTADLTDSDVFHLCAERDFEYLMEFWLVSAPELTIASAQLLAGHCPVLRMIGEMSGWCVNEEEVDTFRIILKISNVDLRLR